MMTDRHDAHPRPGSVAVIILTYNEEPNLPQALESVIGWADEVFVLGIAGLKRGFLQ